MRVWSFENMRGVVLCLAIAGCCLQSSGQKPSPAPDQLWDAPPLVKPTYSKQLKLDLSHRYVLPELIDLAEQNNPATRVAWEQAKARASELGIAHSEMYPTLIAAALATSYRTGVLFGPTFVRQTVDVFQPTFSVDYTIWDFGRRTARISEARQQLIATNFAFNEIHLFILFETSRRYYQLLNDLGQADAARTNLRNAEAVRASVEARLTAGLATLPDALEARAAAAQADYELQAAIGETEISRGALLNILGASPVSSLEVQPLSELYVPDQINEDAQTAIDRALEQRPDLNELVAQRRSAQAGLKGARSAYLPNLTIAASTGRIRAYGYQNEYPGSYAGPSWIWDANMRLSWTIFDGARRESEISRTHAEERRAVAAIEAKQNDIEQEVWVTFANLQTAFRQKQAAASLLSAASSSYRASLRAYDLGLRNTVDVVSAQRTLALALSQEVTAKTNVLTQLATLAYRTADVSRVQRGATP